MMGDLLGDDDIAETVSYSQNEGARVDIRALVGHRDVSGAFDRVSVQQDVVTVEIARASLPYPPRRQVDTFLRGDVLYRVSSVPRPDPVTDAWAFEAYAEP